MTTLSSRDLEKMAELCKQVITAYSVRLRLMNSKHKILESVKHEYSQIVNNPNFYAQLEVNLTREERLLEQVKSGAKGMGGGIRYAMRELEYATNDLQSWHRGDLFKSHPELVHMADELKSISKHDLKVFFIDMLAFLQAIENELDRIEKHGNQRSEDYGFLKQLLFAFKLFPHLCQGRHTYESKNYDSVRQSEPCKRKILHKTGLEPSCEQGLDTYA